MTHGHAGTELRDPHRPTLVATLALIVGVIAACALAGVVWLWPHDPPHGQNPYAGPGVSRVTATVVSVTPFDCGNTGIGPDNTPVAAGACAKVRARLDTDGLATFTVDPTRYVGAPLEQGDRVKLIRIAPEGLKPSFEYYDTQRGGPMLLLTAAFVAAVIAVGRMRGLRALVGVVVTVFALGKFVLPALLAGEPAVPVAVVGATTIMIAVLYLAHGVSVRTTAALFGTLLGLVVTAITGVAATGWTSLTGVGDENDRLLVATAPEMSLAAVAAASMVIAGLGVLNDVTVTQASAVWEMRALKPHAQTWELFTSAMRIGRDHIASSVYTLVFAYAGSAMTILLLVTAYQRGLTDIATSEQIAEEIVRTMVGALGLVLAVPITTAIAVWLCPHTLVTSPGPTPGAP